MEQLTPEGQQQVADLAQRYGVSVEAVKTLLIALVNGNGTMAQFEHRELGGRGQWMAGGMVMVGDMMNHTLKAKVDGLCSELASLLAAHPFQPVPSSREGQSQGGQQQQQQGSASQPAKPLAASSPVSLFIPPPAGSAGEWWPADLGTPATVGSQNGVRYAYFPAPRRLAVEVSGRVTLYDTGDHQISGVSQQQGRGSSLTFTSQHGVVALVTLPVVSGRQPESPGDVLLPQKSPPSPLPPVPPAGATSETDIFATLERLAELKQKGILSEEEFAAKKAELLARL